MNMIKVGIAGCMGRMGSELVKAVCSNKNMIFIGGFEKHGNINTGKQICELINVKNNSLIYDNPNKIFTMADVVIDFTTPESTLQNIKFARQYKKPIVIGTTGLTNQIMKKIKENSKKIPILQSSNMSIGINLLFNLVENASRKLISKKYDVEISETHHRHKIDAPSGTAIALGEVIAKGRGISFNSNKVYDRSSKKLKRRIGQIGFAVTRAGEIAGEHTVNFIGDDDQIEFVHKAKNRKIFVDGAILATEWIVKQKSGLYSMRNILK